MFNVTLTKQSSPGSPWAHTSPPASTLRQTNQQNFTQSATRSIHTVHFVPFSPDVPLLRPFHGDMVFETCVPQMDPAHLDMDMDL